MPKFLIADYKTGVDTDKEPWLIPEDAFPELDGMYVFRGRVRRQPGYRFLGQMVSSNNSLITVLNGTGDFAGLLAPTPIARNSVRTSFVGPGPVTYTFIDDGIGNLILNPPVALTITGITQAVSAVVTTSVPHSFTIGDLVRVTGVNGMDEINDVNYTVTAVPGATLVELSVDSTTFSSYVNSGNINWVGTINYFSGAITLSSPIINAALPITITFGVASSLPIMGFGNREVPGTNFEQLIVFNTTNANLYDAATNTFLDITSTPWTGGNSDFFWTSNYYFTGIAATKSNIFWATNNVVADQIKFYNGTVWTNFSPTLTATGDTLRTCLIIIPYKGRMVALNTIERDGGAGTDTVFQNRCRFSVIGDPTISATAWLTQAGAGGFVDAPTNESIVSTEYIQDTLLVFFERSTWRLVDTGGHDFPFAWEQINTELGCESTFSKIPFDKTVLAVGDKGIFAADYNNVIRLDQIIPDFVFEIQNTNNGPQRVWGVRDYYRELVYWTIPTYVRDDNNQNQTFPNRLLTYNYREKAFSIFFGSFTALGTVQLNNSRTWAGSRQPWNGANFPWSDPITQGRFPLIVGGNQQGLIHFLDDNISNSFCLLVEGISNDTLAVVTSTNHNLEEGEVITFSEVEGMTEINGVRVVVDTILTANTFSIILDTTTFGVYTLGGILTCHFNFRAKTKRFNPFIQEDSSVDVSYLDMFLNNTGAGEFTLNTYVDTNDNTAMPNLFTNDDSFIVSTSESNTFMPGSGQDKVWARIHAHCTGQFIQFEMFLSDSQMLDPDIQGSDVVIHAMTLNAEPHGRLI